MRTSPPTGVAGSRFGRLGRLVRPAPGRPQHRDRLAGHPRAEPADARRQGRAVQVGDVYYYHRKLRRAVRRRAGPDAERVPHPGGLDPAAPLRRHAAAPASATWSPSWSSCSLLDAAFTYAALPLGRSPARPGGRLLGAVRLPGRGVHLPALRPAARGAGRRRAARCPPTALGHRGADRAGRGRQAVAGPADPVVPAPTRPDRRPAGIGLRGRRLRPGRRSACWPAAGPGSSPR